MYDFSNDSHLLSPISQGYVGWSGNVMVRDRTAIPELQFVAKQPEEDIGMPDRKISLQNRESEKIQLANRPVTAKARLETNESLKEKVRVLIGNRPASGYTVAKNVPSPGGPDLTPYKEKFEVLPSYRPQIFPAKTYLTRQGNLMLYAVRDLRQNELPPTEELYENRQRYRPISAMVKPKNNINGQKGLTRSNKSDSKDRPKSAPPAKVSEQESINSESKSKNRIKTDAELFAELKAEICAGKSKKQNRPLSAKKKGRSLSAKKRKKVSTNVTPEGHNLPPGTNEGHNLAHGTHNGDISGGSFEMDIGTEEVSSSMGLIRVEGRGGGITPQKIDPRRAKLREQAEKRRLEMEAMRQEMRSQLISQSETEPVISDNELDYLLVPDSSSSQLECDISVEELEKKVSTHSLVSSDNSLTDLLANRIAEQKRFEELEAQRAALEAQKREEELARLEREAALLRELEESKLREAKERERLEEEKRHKRLEEWLLYQEEIKRERYDSLTKAYWRSNSFNGISRAYTFSYFQSAKKETPRLTHAKKERR